MSPLMILIACGCVSIAPASLAEPQCHTGERYHIAVEPYPDDAGNRFAITRLKGKAPANCAFDESKADFVIGKPGDPLWFSELAGDSLILSRSTGPQGDLVVYDLVSGETILDAPADEYELKDNIVGYWQRTKRATAGNCPSFAENEANGLGSMIAVFNTLNLDNKAVTDTGESKCVPVQ